MSLINEHLKELVADSFILYMKSLHTHWNMKDERFYFLHRLIEEQRRTNWLLQRVVWGGVGFLGGLIAMQLLVRLHHLF